MDERAAVEIDVIIEAFPPSIRLVVHTDAIRSREPGILTLDLTATGDTDCVLGMIHAAPKAQGAGSRVMADLCRRADELGVSIALKPRTSFGSTERRLVRFFERHGFSRTTGNSFRRTPAPALEATVSDGPTR